MRVTHCQVSCLMEECRNSGRHVAGHFAAPTASTQDKIHWVRLLKHVGIRRGQHWHFFSPVTMLMKSRQQGLGF